MPAASSNTALKLDFFGTPRNDYQKAFDKYVTAPFLQATSVEIKGFIFDQYAAQKFSELLSKCTIKSISLEDCSIGSALLTKLDIGSCASLQKLSIVRCSVNQASISDLLNTITSASFEHLELVSCSDRYDHSAKPVALPIERFSRLKFLRIHKLPKYKLDFKQLLISVQRIKALEELHLTECIMEDLAMHIFSSLTFATFNTFFPNLRVLNLSHNEIRSEITSAIFKLFKILPKMQSLDLSGNFNFSDYKIQFTDLSKTLTTLRLPMGEGMFADVAESSKAKLDPLIKSRINDLSIPLDENTLWYMKYISQMTHLVKLDISYSGSPTQTPLSIHWKCLNLKELDFHVNIFNSCFQSLHNSFPRLENLSVCDSMLARNPVPAKLFTTVIQCKKLKHFSSAANFILPSNIDKQVLLRFTGQLESLNIAIAWLDFKFLMANSSFKNLTKLKLNLKDCPQIGLDDIFDLLAKIPKLESLELMFFKVNGHIGKFKEDRAYSFVHLKKLNLAFMREKVELNYDYLFAMMPNLQSFSIDCDQFAKLSLSRPTKIRNLKLSTTDIHGHKHFSEWALFFPFLTDVCCNDESCTLFKGQLAYADIAWFLYQFATRLGSHFVPQRIDPNSMPMILLRKDKMLLEMIKSRSDLTSFLNKILPSNVADYPSFSKYVFSYPFQGDHQVNFNGYSKAPFSWTNFTRTLNFALDSGLCTNEKVISLQEIYSLSKILIWKDTGKNAETELVSSIYFFSKFAPSFEPVEGNLCLKELLRFCSRNCITLNDDLWINPKVVKCLSDFIASYRSSHSPSQIVSLLETVFWIITDQKSPISVEKKRRILPNVIIRNFVLFERLFGQNSIEFIRNFCIKSLPLAEIELLKKIQPEFKVNLWQKQNFTELAESDLQLMANYLRVAPSEAIHSASLFTKLSGFLKGSVSFEKCSICLEFLFTSPSSYFLYSLNSQSKSCHLFHSNCLNEWTKKQNNCPVCKRTPFSSD